MEPDDDLLLPVNQDTLTYNQTDDQIGNKSSIEKLSFIYPTQSLERHLQDDPSSFKSLRMRHDRVMAPSMPTRLINCSNVFQTYLKLSSILQKF